MKQLKRRSTGVQLRSDKFELTTDELEILLQGGVHLTISEDESDAELLEFYSSCVQTSLQSAMSIQCNTCNQRNDRL